MQPENGLIADIDITGLTNEGAGIGRLSGMAVFVRGALPGERVKARLFKVRKNFAEARLVEILSASPDRISPSCSLLPIADPCESSRCGGCNLSHLSYPAQLTYKRQKVVDALERIGRFNVASEGVEVYPTLPSPDETRYRNKIQLLASDNEGEPSIGYCAPGENTVIEIHDCLLVPEHVTAVAIKAAELVKAMGIPVKRWPVSSGRRPGHRTAPVDQLMDKPVLRHVIVRTAKDPDDANRNKLMIILVTDPGRLDLKPIIAPLTAEFPEISTVVRNINHHPSSEVPLGNRNEVLYGAGYLMDELGGLRFKLSPTAFYQVNPRQTLSLYSKALEYAAPSADDVVYDLYCGVGTISLFVARCAKKVVGIEVVESAIVDARENAEINGIANVHFMAGTVEGVLPQAISRYGRPDIVILDPPRSGCDKKVLEVLVNAAPRRIAYVSCDPATMARDLALLRDLGGSGGTDYRLLKVQPVDMFPQTSHVETVVLIGRK